MSDVKMTSRHRIIDIIAEVLGRQESELDLSASPTNTPGWDSFANIQILSSLMEEGLILDVERYFACKDIGEIIKLSNP